jgi:hypothetical protein
MRLPAAKHDRITGTGFTGLNVYIGQMTKLEEIETAVSKLSDQERAKLRAWLDELDDQAFDARIERDAKAGHLDKFAAEAIKEDEDGLTTDL